jgi:hypothetical protein
MKKKIVCIDIDGVICKTKKNNYKSSKPINQAIKKIKKLKEKFYIKLFTARFMGRSNENKIKAEKKGYKTTKLQLKKWGVEYDELIFGKPSYDYIIDDKSIFFKKNWYRVNFK